ncbi:helix-turn-helix domain-containing protein [Variovorax sp.]|uniref:GlxA family transcriptional regulator n=1 Tax=Variovorax sp. TaxID=1871043 RepID=UPI000C619277|nr:helix-turn-helix domain-containing protein [Variovorax sp.]MBS81394.1 hypothetical protein [Variovorax sp.]
MIRFDLYLPHGGLPGSVFGAIDILREANSLARARAGRRIDAPVAWRLLGPDGGPHAMRRLAFQSDEEAKRSRRAPATALAVVPPLMMVTIPGLRRLVAQNAALCAQLASRHAAGDWIGACGTGLWLAGRAGLLAHQPVPLSWLYQSGFAHDFPDTPIHSETPLTLGPHMVLAATPDLMHAMVLKLLDGVGLSDLAAACRDKFLANPERQHLVLDIPEQVVGTSRDAPLHRAIAFIEANAGRPLTVAEMASAAAVSERTLVRLFARHIERSPIQFLHELRVKRARMWLEATWRSMHEIADASGYADVSTFRRTFKRIAGMSPSEYRERYTVRTPRAVWQLQAYDDVLPPGKGKPAARP